MTTFVWPTSHVGIFHPYGAGPARAQTRNFYKFVRLAVSGLKYIEIKRKFSDSISQVETRKSLYEELGLCYVAYRSNTVTLTDAGRQIYDMLVQRKQFSEEELGRRITATLTFCMSRVQINRPQSLGSPNQKNPAKLKACNIRPYALAWRAAIDLDGSLAMHEFGGVLSKIWDASEYGPAIIKIREARKSKTRFPAEAVQSKNYFIYWKSHLSVGNTLLLEDGRTGTLFINPVYRDLLTSTLRLGSGCANDPLQLIQSREWVDATDYFENIAGAACPPFLKTEAPIVLNISGTPVIDLSNFPIEIAAANYTVSGGPALCEIPLKTPCYHSEEPGYFLRIDTKDIKNDGSVALQLGRGRRILKPDLARKVFGRNNVD